MRTCFCSLYPGGDNEAEEVEQDALAADADQALIAVRATCLYPVFNNATRRARCEYCGHSSGIRMFECANCQTAACWDCYDRLNIFAISASELSQEAALMRANLDREDELGD